VVEKDSPFGTVPERRGEGRRTPVLPQELSREPSLLPEASQRPTGNPGAAAQSICL